MTKRIQITEEQVPCGCGRSASGFCIGLHNLTEAEYHNYLQRPMPWADEQTPAPWPDNPLEG